METKKSFCRMCVAYCGINAEVDQGQLMSVKADPDHALSRGFSCVKGRRIPDIVNHPSRLKHSLKRNKDGSFDAIGNVDATSEIADQLNKIIDQYGPRAVATYTGTGCWGDSVLRAVVKSWHKSIGSVMRCSSASIDQPAKFVTPWHLGAWGAGPHSFLSAKVIMLIGQNPIISGQYHPGGPPYPSDLHDARRRGLKVIVVDPRKTEQAQQADIHLQVIPGEDPTLMAAMLNVILKEQLYDKDFCDQHVKGLQVLRESVADFSPAYAAKRCGLAEEDIIAAARLFASEDRGIASTGSGTCMAPNPNLTEHLVLCINTVCGRWNREGEPVNMPSILTGNNPRPAQAVPAEFLPEDINPFANSEISRIRGIRQVNQEMPTGALADEILTPGDGQVRALIVAGGNPVLAWPDQARTLKALEQLDLLVCLDIRPTETTQRADYVIATSHFMEREDLSFLGDYFYEKPFCQHTEAVIDKGAEQLDEWQFFANLSKAMGLELELPSGALDLNEMPSALEMFERVCPNTKVPIAEIAKYPGGHIFDEVDVRASAAAPGVEARLNVGHGEMMAELKAIRTDEYDDYKEQGFSHRLVARREKHMLNSLRFEHENVASETPYNPAYLNPNDLQSLNIATGDTVKIHSEDGSIFAVVKAAPDIRPGVISMAHCFGGDPGIENDPKAQGSCTGALISVEHHYDPITGAARQSAIPVKVEVV